MFTLSLTILFPYLYFDNDISNFNESMHNMYVSVCMTAYIVWILLSDLPQEHSLYG